MYSQGMAPVYKIIPGRPKWERIQDKPVYTVMPGSAQKVLVEIYCGLFGIADKRRYFYIIVQVSQPRKSRQLYILCLHLSVFLYRTTKNASQY